MKAKKALKRLTRVEALLSDVLKQYAASEKEVRESLDSAKASVARAFESVKGHIAAALDTKKAKKPAKAKKAAQRKRRVVVASAPSEPAPVSETPNTHAATAEG